MAEEKKELKNYTRIFNPILEAIVKQKVSSVEGFPLMAFVISIVLVIFPDAL